MCTPKLRVLFSIIVIQFSLSQLALVYKLLTQLQLLKNKNCILFIIIFLVHAG